MNKIEIIKTELQKPEYQELIIKQDYPRLAEILNKKPLIDNPESQKTISKPITTIGLWQQITPQEGLEIYKIPALKPDINEAVASGDRQSLQALLAIASQILSPESVAKIQTLFSQKIPDPSYKARIQGESVAESLGLGFVREDEIQAALNLE